MFRSIGRILRWTGEYRKRLYAGCICSFFATWCTAGPVMVAAWALGKVIEDYRGGEQIKGSFIWLCLGAVAGFIFFALCVYLCEESPAGEYRYRTDGKTENGNRRYAETSVSGIFFEK